MHTVCISGSPREQSNTDYLLNLVLNGMDGELIKLSDCRIEPCNSCWGCVKTRECTIKDDMTDTIIPKILKADIIVLGSPVYFNNVSAQMKAFMDRTWAIRTKLRNKVGAAVVVGRRYGAESAITAIHSFFLKHEMLVAQRGISGVAFDSHEIEQDEESIEVATMLSNRLTHLARAVNESEE
ncbi:MAG: flavodoxin family protein [Planctomycetota bacterium]